MPRILFKPSGKEIVTPPHTNLLRAAHLADIELAADCGGRGSCGKCIVVIQSGHVRFEDGGKLSTGDRKEGRVLACQTVTTTEDIVVDVSPSLLCFDHSPAASHSPLPPGSRIPVPGVRCIQAFAQQYSLTIPPPDPDTKRPDSLRLTDELAAVSKIQDIQIPLSVLRVLPQTLRCNKGLITVTVVRNASSLTVIDVTPETAPKPMYGIAVDCGTTTIAVELIDMTNGVVCATDTGYNRQISRGSDVISRIEYCRKAEGLGELQSCVTESINRGIRHVAKCKGISPRSIMAGSLAGNTTMIHLLLGINPDFIRRAPYVPAVHTLPFLSASTMQLDIHPEARIHCAPSVSSYVGGDITAGLLCTGIAKGLDTLWLHIDIGTNGEMALGNSDFLLTGACSAGPAFEGGGLSCGMRAESGAIHRVSVNPDTAEPMLETIDKRPPRGICGSGIISLLASLFRTGWIDRAGKLDRNRTSSCIVCNGRRAYYVLANKTQSGTGKEVIVSEADIETVLRAKAAVFAGCSLLVQQVGITFNDIATISVAGGFGRHLCVEDTVTIGMLPDLPSDRYHYLGNTSLQGSSMALVSEKHRRCQQELADRATVLELSNEASYMDEYTAALFIPHTDENRFPSLKNSAPRRNVPEWS